MKNIFVVFLMLTSIAVYAQPAKADEIAKMKDKVVQFINEKKADSLYNLAGVDFKKQLPFDNFENWCIENIYPLGKIKQAELKSVTNGIAKYKVVFKKDSAAMLLGIDAKMKFNAFGFQSWEEEIEKAVKSDNALLTELDKQIDNIVKPFMQKGKTIGLSIGILKNGETFFYNYGETKKGSGKIPTAKNLYEIGSITKTFTGILLAKAVTENKIRLNEPVNKYLPKDIPVIKFGSDTLKIVHLANHTSGLPRLPLNFNFTNEENPYFDYDNAKMYAYLKNAKLAQRPGEKYEYSNLAVGMLGVILENVNKMSFEKMVTDIITSKAGMTNTKQALLAKDNAMFVQGYDENLSPKGLWDFKALAATGCLRSNAEDMIKFAQLNTGAKNTSLQKAISLSHTPTFEKGNTVTALNWHILNTGRGRLIWHNGGTGGFRSILIINSKTKNAVVVLSNTAIGNDNVGSEILKLLDK